MTDLHVSSIDTTIVDLPLRRPHRFARHVIDRQTYLIVRLVTDAGTIGVGEGVSPGGPWWNGESVEGQQQMVEHYIAPALIGSDCLDLQGALLRMDQVAYANDFAKAAVEMALTDAAARAHGVPAHVLIGGAATRRSFPVRWALSGLGEEPVVQDAAEHIALGHRALKLKMGALDPEEDLRRVALLLDKIGEELDYIADPNCSWDYRTAVWAVRELEAMGVRAVEQPLERSDLSGMADLCERTTRIRLIADESVCRPADAVAVARHRACDAVAVKPAKAGGLRRAARVASIIDSANMSCYGGTALESSLGTAAAAQLFASMDQLDMGCELIGPLLLADDLVVKPLSYRDGNLQLPDGPGLGVEVDWDQVGRYARNAR